jgi:phage terminase large subunit GpA-like protein
MGMTQSPTITELQTERARLKATEAQRKFTEALAQTRRAEDLHAVSAAVRRLIADSLDDLPARFAALIAGETEETRVHYLLSEAAHQLLATIAAKASATTTALPELKELVTRASRNAANRADILEYGANCRLIKAGANSADSLRSDHLPYVICDEVDAYKWDVGGEGDPMTLIENRQRTFSRAKTFLISTPTNEGESRIYQAYLRSDRRRYHVPCPHCGTHQPLIWSPETMRYRIEIVDHSDGKATDAATEQKVVVDAWYVCTDCGAEIREGSKPAMLAAGRWIAQRPHVKATRGYHINALYSPVGLGLTWLQICQKWVDAQQDSSALKAFINTYLGEVWREEGDGADANTLQTRVEQWDAEEIRVKVRPLRVVAGVDVQKDRLEATVAGFSTGEECWVLDHIIIPGDTTQIATWDDLHAALSDAGVTRAAIDSGFNTSFVQAFCDRYNWAIATKGISGRGRTLIDDDLKRRQRLRRKRKRGQPVEPIGVDQGKSIIYARLKLPKPGPGYFHFPADSVFDDEYFPAACRRRAANENTERPPVRRVGADSPAKRGA